MNNQFNATGGSPVPGSLYPTMTPQEEQQVAQQFVEERRASAGERFAVLAADGSEIEGSVTPLDNLAMAKHLCNIAKLAADMLTNDALRDVNRCIEKHALDDNGVIVEANKQFVFHGNKWMYQIKENYNQLGNQRLSDGSFDPNSQTYHSLEMQQEQMKKDSKALTAQMAGLKERILNDHPQLKPSEIVVSLALKGQA